MPPDDLMELAIEAAFQKVLEATLQPLVTRLTELEVLISTLSAQQAEVLALVNGLKANGMAKRLLGIG